jgi:hypothetical protein
MNLSSYLTGLNPAQRHARLVAGGQGGFRTVRQPPSCSTGCFVRCSPFLPLRPWHGPHVAPLADYQRYYVPRGQDGEPDAGPSSSSPASVRTDVDALVENHRFIRSEADDAAALQTAIAGGASAWEVRLAKKYYDRLFKVLSTCVSLVRGSRRQQPALFLHAGLRLYMCSKGCFANAQLSSLRGCVPLGWTTAGLREGGQPRAQPRPDQAPSAATTPRRCAFAGVCHCGPEPVQAQQGRHALADAKRGEQRSAAAQPESSAVILVVGASDSAC